MQMYDIKSTSQTCMNQTKYEQGFYNFKVINCYTSSLNDLINENLLLDDCVETEVTKTIK